MALRLMASNYLEKPEFEVSITSDKGEAGKAQLGVLQ